MSANCKTEATSSLQRSTARPDEKPASLALRRVKFVDDIRGPHTEEAALLRGRLEGWTQALTRSILRDASQSKSAVADFDPSLTAEVGQARLRCDAPQTVCPFPCGGDSPSMRLRGLPGMGRA